MNIGRLIAALFSAVPQFWLGWTFLSVLHEPLAGGNRAWATDAWLIMVMEFLLVHAGFMSMAVVAVRKGWPRAGAALGLGAFYALFFTGFWFISDGSPIVLAPAVLLAGRLLDAHGAGGSLLGERIFVSVTGALLYLIGAFATSIPESFPRFGFTPAVMAELAPAFGDTGGLWIDDPQRVVLFGACYFIASGLLDLARGWHMARRATA